MLSQTVSDILLNICYAYCVTYSFYLLGVYLPQKRNEYYYRKLIFRRIFHINCVVHGIIKDLENGSNIKYEDNLESIEKMLDAVETNEKLLNSITYLAKHINKLIGELSIVSFTMDSQLLLEMDKIYLECKNISFIYTVQGKTFGQSHADPIFELITITESIVKNHKRKIDEIGKQFSS